jgi:integrase
MGRGGGTPSRRPGARRLAAARRGPASRDKGGSFKPSKSRHGIRDAPLSPALVGELRAHLARLRPDGPEALAFPSRSGTPKQYPNALRRALRPAAEEAGAGWGLPHVPAHGCLAALGPRD